MFIKNTWKEKLIVSLLVFCIMFSHCSTFAAFIVDFSQGYVEAFNQNIEMSAYIATSDGQKLDAYVATNSEEELTLNVLLKVTSGYVKNPVLSITNLENEIFEIDESRLDCEFIQSIVENEITISRLNEGEDCLVQIPIVMKEENYYNPYKTNSNIEFVLKGTYVDLNSNHFEFKRMSYATLGWDLISNIQISSEVEKSFEYTAEETKYMLVQYTIDVELGEESKSFPVESTTLNFKVPENDSLVPQTVSVGTVNTSFTNGLTANDVIFTENNWSYADGNVTINVLNAPVEEQGNKYIIPQGKDKYIVTVVYAVNGENLELETNILASVRVYNNGTSKSFDAEGTVSYNLADASGNLVTYGVETVEKEISKGNIFANYNIEKDFYETEYTSVIDINVSKADFVKTIEVREQEEYFLSEEGEKYSTINNGKNNTYYKTTIFNKEKLDSILGETGNLKILNEKGEILLTLDKTQEADENGNIVISYGSKITNIIIRVENPEKEGILNIVNTKAIEKLNYSQMDVVKFNNLVSKYVAAAIYDGDIKDDLGVITNKIGLKNTKTTATVSTGRKVLSTLVENKNIELKIALNNYNEQTDLYKNPVFEITLPKQIEEVKVNDMSILYGNNELSISNIEAYKNEKGNIVIRVSLKGTQTQYSLVEITEGTNVILNVDMKVNIYTPSVTSKITMKYYNENATDYDKSIPWKMDAEKKDGTLINANGSAETELSVIAPSGVVSAQRASGYNGKNKLYSINQGVQVDRILTNIEKQRVTSEIIVMNNSEEVMNNVAILGRTGFKGNTLNSNNEDLGTTINTKVVSELSEIYGVYKNVKIYYSENGNATKEITEPSNSWTTDFKSIENIRSYLIVLEESLNVGEIVVFSYDYELPENLPCDSAVYTTFNTYYTNSENEYVSEEADTIGLETVSSPKIKVDITSNAGDSVTEGQMIEYTVTVKNIGEVDAEDIKVNLKIPTDTTYVEYVAENEGGTYRLNEEVKELNVDVGEIKVGEEKVYTYTVRVNEKAEQVSSAKVTATAEGLEETGNTNTENGEGTPGDGNEEAGETQTEAETDETDVAEPDIGIEFTQEYEGMTVRENAELIHHITLKNNTENSIGIVGVKYPDGTIISKEEHEKRVEEWQAEQDKIAEEKDANGEEYEYPEYDAVEFIKGKKLNNIKLEQTIPEGTTFIKAYVMKYNSETKFDEKMEIGTYNAETRIYSLDIDKLEVGEAYELNVITKTDFIKEEQKEISSEVKVKADETEEYVSTKIQNLIGRPILDITFTSSATNESVKENKTIEYKLTIKNTGSFEAQDLMITDVLPDELKGISASYYFKSKPSDIKNIDIILPSKMNAILTLKRNDTVVLKLKTKVKSLNQKEKQIENSMSIESINLENILYTDILSTVVQKAEKKKNTSNNNKKPNVVMVDKNKTETTQTVKKYKVSGKAWLDLNKNGKRDSSEKGLPNVLVKLYSANTNNVVAKVSTDGSGNYVFSNITNGKYYIVFGYDTTRYALTESKKSNVDSSINSDALWTNSLAITDIVTVNNGNISNVDIGLVEAAVFDLALKKDVNKITVQTKSGTKAYKYNTSSFAKIDIAAKELEGARVYLEYYITVANKGEIAGYAKKIVDYIPAGTIFSPDLNPGWYQAENGSIYSDALADTIINPGETKTIKLVLVKQMTENNIGIISNSAEIAETYNEAAIEDTDSEAGNRVDGEDDLGTADIVISVKTGGNLISGTIMIAVVAVALVGIYVFKKNVVERIRRW